MPCYEDGVDQSGSAVVVDHFDEDVDAVPGPD